MLGTIMGQASVARWQMRLVILEISLGANAALAQDAGLLAS